MGCSVLGYFPHCNWTRIGTRGSPLWGASTMWFYLLLIFRANSAFSGSSFATSRELYFLAGCVISRGETTFSRIVLVGIFQDLDGSRSLPRGFTLLLLSVLECCQPGNNLCYFWTWEFPNVKGGIHLIRRSKSGQIDQFSGVTVPFASGRTFELMCPQPFEGPSFRWASQFQHPHA